MKNEVFWTLDDPISLPQRFPSVGILFLAFLSENILQLLAEEYELPKIILEHRTLSKLKQTYTDRLPLQISPSTNLLKS